MALRVGLLGLSYGARVHLPAYKANPKYELVAVCARTPGRAEAAAREHNVPHWFTDARKLIAMPGLDLISIATPPATHAGYAAAALAAGKHVVVEIPFVPTAENASVLRDMARDSGRLAAVAYVLRYAPTLRMVADMLAQGAIGQPRLMVMDFFASFLGQPDPADPWRWLRDADSGGGILAGFVAHGLDLARQWFGPVADVSASLATLSDAPAMPAGRRQADDTGLVTLRFDSGLLAAFNYSASVADNRTRIALRGSEATLLIEGFGDHVSLLPMGQSEARPVYPGADLLAETRGQSGLTGGFQNFLARLAHGVAQGHAPPDLPTFEDGWQISRLLDTAQLASREGRRVQLDEIA